MTLVDVVGVVLRWMLLSIWVTLIDSIIYWIPWHRAFPAAVLPTSASVRYTIQYILLTGPIPLMIRWWWQNSSNCWKCNFPMAHYKFSITLDDDFGDRSSLLRNPSNRCDMIDIFPVQAIQWEWEGTRQSIVNPGRSGYKERTRKAQIFVSNPC